LPLWSAAIHRRFPLSRSDLCFWATPSGNAAQLKAMVYSDQGEKAAEAALESGDESPHSKMSNSKIKL
jgi:hypothetical protein